MVTGGAPGLVGTSITCCFSGSRSCSSDAVGGAGGAGAGEGSGFGLDLGVGLGSVGFGFVGVGDDDEASGLFGAAAFAEFVVVVDRTGGFALGGGVVGGCE